MKDYLKTKKWFGVCAIVGVLCLGRVSGADAPDDSAKTDSTGHGKTAARPTVLTHGRTPAGKTGLKDAPAARNLTQPSATVTVPSGATKSLPNPASAKSLAPASAGKTGTAANKLAPPTKPTVGSVPSAMAPGAPRNRTVTAAAIGGAASSGAKNSSASVNGASVKRKTPPN